MALLTPAPHAPKRPDIEGLRLASAFGIVWFHAGTSASALAYSGLMVFLVLSVALGGRSGRPDGATLRRRAVRLLRPWLVWFGLYAAFNVARGLPALSLEHGLPAGILAGPSIHLWYLPFVFMVLAGLDLLRAHIAPRTLSAAAFGLALALLATAPGWRPVTLSLIYPALQWADALAPVLVGVFALGARDGCWPRPVARAMAAVLVLAAAVLVVFEWVGTPYAVGLAASLFVLLRTPRSAPAWAVKFAPVTDCAFGIYLSHSLVFALLLAHGPELSADALPLAIFAVALAGTWALRRGLPRVAAWLT
jgi:surface polysaccharide O-acyltransferase-like enzyme